MRALTIPAFAAGLLTASLAFAATQSATGSIKSIDTGARTLTLEDGTTYHLAAHVKEKGLKTGEKVQVTWDMKNGKHEATKVSVVK